VGPYVLANTLSFCLQEHIILTNYLYFKRETSHTEEVLLVKLNGKSKTYITGEKNQLKYFKYTKMAFKMFYRSKRSFYLFQHSKENQSY
jgi:hypothetical protein